MDEEYERWFNKIIGTGNVLAIIDNARIVAFSLLYCNHKDTGDAYLCNVFVLKDYRGIGLSCKLLDKAVAICKDLKFKSISLHVAIENKVAIRIYEKYGFKAVHNDNVEDNRVVMRLYIN